ncbi:glycoside hydrolase family 43 protein [Peterkaempfera griseoplana]|uniref:glycoside hydrolase family 43 protein n=1 Tax=Peterkaempfera griseoplana TaxID=66896 RepID=UPI0006E1BCBF|nr:glycoside hydrolase family 43 protein [Peterkaempfera griseoplana]
MPGLFRNPVIPGFHPDPSICRVGDDYYLVTSSFEWFPGLPLFHSRDLVNWRQLGHVLDRPSQLDLDGMRPNGGIYAPTLRHHDGVFYVITTHVGGGGHFVVTATDPAGPWSEPHWIEGDGIDPSLFFDTDGRAWIMATRGKAEQAHDGDNEIWLREFDVAAMKPVGEEHVIWDGALKVSVWPEGPHLYRIGDWYLLLVSEGGTEADHALVVARSRSVTGPYVPNLRNPILTHRHLSRRHPIGCVGHADLVQTPAGEWWMVLLGMRTGSNLGRETFLTRVEWEDDWPVVSQVEAVATAPDLPPHPWPALPACDRFDAPDLAPHWAQLRTPREDHWSTRDGRLRLRLRPERLGDPVNPGLLARPVQDLDFAAHLSVDVPPGGEAGLALLLNDWRSLRLVVSDRGLELVRRAGEEAEEEVLARADCRPRLLGVEAHGAEHRFRYAVEPGGWQELAVVDGSFLSPSAPGDFTGVCIGPYAHGDAGDTGDTGDAERFAAFDWFEYLPLPPMPSAG